MKILRCWCSNPTGGKLFAIDLLFTMKQYKVDNIVNFVYYGKTRKQKNIYKPTEKWADMGRIYCTLERTPIPFWAVCSSKDAKERNTILQITKFETFQRLQ